MKDERELLTREIVAEKLAGSAKHSMIGSVLLLILGIVGFGILLLMDSMMNDSIGISLTVIVDCVLLAACVIVCVCFFARGAKRLIRARRGDFTVIDDVLSDVKEDQLSIGQMILTGRIHDRMNYRHVLYFESGRKFVANSEEYRHTRLEAAVRFSLPGDVFHLVCYNDDPKKIILLFASKIYRYQGSKGESL